MRLYIEACLCVLTLSLLVVANCLDRETAASANIPEQELYALNDLYMQTDGDDWVWNANDGTRWDFTIDANPCTENWQGINCSFPSPFEYYHVVALDLTLHNLVGYIPSTLGLLSELETLKLGLNYLYGPIPPGFRNFTKIQIMDLHGNEINGPVPGFLSNLSALVALDVYNNVMSGPLPNNLDNLQNLTEFRFDANYISGTIPASFGLLANLKTLNGEINYLSQSIPTSLGLLSELVNFYFKDNLLSGQVPRSMANLTHLAGFELGENYITGTVPEFLCNLKELMTVSVYNNEFTGTIHSGLGNLPKLLILALSLNHLTGSIPVSLTALQSLSQVFMYSNHISGTIPRNIGNMTSLATFSVFHNQLTGTAPASIARLTKLEILVVDHNQLTGNLDSVFDPANQQNLETVIVNNNQFTGTLPAYLLNARSLKTFVAVSNCFHGELDGDQLCAGKAMITLVLDGLSSATSCRQLLTFGFSGGYLNTNPVHGTVPSCLFQLPNLTILHMSGNAFTGALPSNLILSDSLFDLTLSHNILTGSIPVQIQQRKWYNLDLSYNRFSGTMNSQFATQEFNFSYLAVFHNIVQEFFITVLNISDFHVNISDLHPRHHRNFAVENNRLSGIIPQSAQDLSHVSVLGTNMFSCALDGSGLPENDPGRRNYQCGSTAFNIPYYIWLSLCGAIFGAFVAVVVLQDRCGRFVPTVDVNKWVHLIDSDLLLKAGLMGFDKFLTDTSRLTSVIVAVILLVLLSVYCVLGAFYGTLTYEYTWYVSAAFLSGVLPAALCFVLWTIGVGCLIVLTLHAVGETAGATEQSTFSNAKILGTPSACTSTAVHIVYVAVNLIVVVGANAAYVYVYIYQSSELQVLAQVLLSFFKMIWNNVCTTHVLHASVKCVRRAQDEHVSDAPSYITLQVFVALLNNILIPCLVVAFVSPSCFYNVFVPAPVIKSSFIYASCKIVGDDGACLTYTPDQDSTSYDPPFTYSYQCSSSMITYYAPAYINLCIVATFVAPMFQLALQRAHYVAAPSTWWFRLLDAVVPFVLKLPSASSTSVPAYATHAPRQTLYNVSQVYAATVTFVGLLLTFGVVFPPLAVALGVTVLASVYFAKLKVGRFLCAAVEQKLPHLVDFIDQDCQAVGSVPLLLHNSTWMVVTIACWFYTLFLFDTLGSAVGLGGAYWVLIVMPLIPLCLYCTFNAYNRRSMHTSEPTNQLHLVVESGLYSAQSSVSNPISIFSLSEESRARLSDGEL